MEDEEEEVCDDKEKEKYKTTIFLKIIKSLRDAVRVWKV